MYARLLACFLLGCLRRLHPVHPGPRRLPSGYRRWRILSRRGEARTMEHRRTSGLGCGSWQAREVEYSQCQLDSKSTDLVRYNSRANINQDLIRDIYISMLSLLYGSYLQSKAPASRRAQPTVNNTTTNEYILISPQDLQRLVMSVRVHVQYGSKFTTYQHCQIQPTDETANKAVKTAGTISVEEQT